MALLDSYERKARLTPGLFAVAPITFAVAALGLKRYPAIAIAAAVFSAAGGSYVLSLLVAHSGRQVQPRLWSKWGGAPVTQLLRSEKSAADSTQRKIWRAGIESLTSISLPSLRRERANPKVAEETITAAINQVRWIGQDPRFPLVAAENAQYGLERNLYGFRWIGRTISGVGTLILLVVFLDAAIGHITGISVGATLAGTVIDAALLFGWVFIPSEQRANAAAFRYGNQLLQAAVNLSRSGTSGSQSTQEDKQ